MNIAPVKGASVNIVLGLCCLAYAIFLYLGALYVAPPIFDPLGSAAVPKICAALIALLAVIILVTALRQRAASNALAAEATDETDETVAQEVSTSPRYDLGLALLVFSAAYVAVMEFGLLGFPIATIVFLFASGLMLGGTSKRNVLLSLFISATVGFGSDFIFTEFFYIQLPR